MKTCIRCEQEKELIHFGSNKRKPDGKQSVCKSCRSSYAKKWYNSNKTEHIKRVATTKTKVVQENRQRLHDYLKTVKCIDCGNSNPIVLDFDHRGDKKYNVSNMLSYSWETIEKEIAKCDVRCANCHRIRTAKQFGWYKNIQT